MNLVIGLVTVLLLSASAYCLTTFLHPDRRSEALLIFFLMFTAQVLILGYLLSAFNVLNQGIAWLAGSLVMGTVFMFRSGPKAWRMLHERWRAWLTLSGFVNDWRNLSPLEKWLLGVPLVTVLFLGIINFGLVLFTPPNNVDSMTYHLARVGYYLQHGNIAYFDTTYWAQVVHPKNSAILLLFTFLSGGRNENLTQLVQFISYWVAILAVYCVSRRSGLNNLASLFSGLVFGLLVEVLLQATTTQNDLLLAALVGCALVFLLVYRGEQRRIYLLLSTFSMAIGLGMKSSFILILPSIAIVGSLAILHPIKMWRKIARDILLLLGSGVIGMALFALPAGYMENVLIFGNPIGPQSVRTLHSFEGQPLEYIVKNGSKNLLRYGFEFLSLDGFPPISPFTNWQDGLRYYPNLLVRKLGIDLESKEAVRSSFRDGKTPAAHEDLSYWGVLGFGLLWLAVILSLFNFFRQKIWWVLALSSLIFLAMQAFSGPYDPWRGRYFLVAGVFTAPLAGRIFVVNESKLIKIYLTFVIVIASISGLSTIIYRQNKGFLILEGNQLKPGVVFSKERLDIIAAGRPSILPLIRNFEILVPKQAAVALQTGGDEYVWPYFGQDLERILIPARSFEKGNLPIPPEGDFLLFSPQYAAVEDGDVFLGSNTYLRPLNESLSYESCVGSSEDTISISGARPFGEVYLKLPDSFEQAQPYVFKLTYTATAESNPYLIVMSEPYKPETISLQLQLIPSKETTNISALFIFNGSKSEKPVVVLRNWSEKGEYVVTSWQVCRVIVN